MKACGCEFFVKEQRLKRKLEVKVLFVKCQRYALFWFCTPNMYLSGELS